MKTILCTGDSHTWGQGVAGLEEFFKPIMAGDLRLIPFHFGCYVNLLREMINRKDGSKAEELGANDLQGLCGKGLHLNCAVIENARLSINTDAELIRIQFHYQDVPSKAAVYIDGKLQREIDLYRQNLRNGYYTDSFFCDSKGKHQLAISAQQGTVLVYRIELYSGETAVINCGIGSCPTFRFLAEYWDNYVVKLKPSIVILEPHTINDWLVGDPPDVYGKRLKEMINRFHEMKCSVVMLTVSPIAGPQDLPFNKIPYSAYVEESRKVAQMCNIPLCDANAVMNRHIEGLKKEQEIKELLFKDNWHVNDFGHRIYADTVFDTLVNMKYI